MNPNVTYNSYGPPGNGSYQQQVVASGNVIYSVDATHSRRQDTMRNSYLSYTSTNTPSWVNPSTMLETQAQSTPVMRGSRPLPDPSHYHGRNGNQVGSMYGGVYGKRPGSGGYAITDVAEEEEYEEGRGGETLGHEGNYNGRQYDGETMGYLMPVGMGIGVPMERVAARGTRPLPIPGASQPLSESSGKRRNSFVGGFFLGLRRLPKRVLRYGSRKPKVVSPELELEHGELEQQEEQEQNTEHLEHSEQSEQEQSEPEQSEQEQSKHREHGSPETTHPEHQKSPEYQSPEHHESPETAHPPPATDYIKMAPSCTIPSSFTNDPSFATELNPLSRCLHALSHLPWVSDRSTVDYSPLAGFGTKSGGRGVLKKQGTSWYRRPGDDPDSGGITGHSLDLLAAEGDGASVGAWRRRVAKRRYHHHRRHRHDHRRYRQRSISTITRQPIPFAYFPAFPGPSDPTTAEMPGTGGRPPLVYMPMMPYT